MTWTYYNDSEPFVCNWLENLIREGLLPVGEVDRRPIQEVTPDDVRGFTQCHFFAGIGGWAYALQLAGWPDDRPVWTGSCPCPPFSAAGKKKPCPSCGGANPVPCPQRTGHFICCLCGHAWFADARHLWPELWRLVAECRPPVLFGEQVASGDARVWLTAVRASLEILDYTVGAADLSAAGVGAPHRRQRLWFVADHTSAGWQGRVSEAHEGPARPVERGATRLVADAEDAHGRRAGDAGNAGRRIAEVGRSSVARVMAHADGGQPRDGDLQRSGEHGQRPQDGGAGGVADTEQRGREGAHVSVRPAQQGQAAPLERGATPWTDVEWLPCRDGKARPTQPGLFPLAHGVPARVGRLRAYGNAINPYTAAAFVRAYLEVAP